MYEPPGMIAKADSKRRNVYTTGEVVGLGASVLGSAVGTGMLIGNHRRAVPVTAASAALGAGTMAAYGNRQKALERARRKPIAKAMPTQADVASVGLRTPRSTGGAPLPQNIMHGYPTVAKESARKHLARAQSKRRRTMLTKSASYWAR